MEKKINKEDRRKKKDDERKEIIKVRRRMEGDKRQVKINEKLCTCLIKHQAMKICGGGVV